MEFAADIFNGDEQVFFTPSSSENLRQPETIRLELTQPCDDESSTCNVPPWMKDYFRWHRQTLQNITQPSDWLQHSLLVLKCTGNDSCGGTADRLRPLPFYLAMAARAKRLFFIRWTKPLPLEAILEPFQLNWAVPSSLAQLIDQGNGTISQGRNLVRMADQSLRSDLWTLQVLSQAMDYYEEYTSVVRDLEDVSSGGSSLHPKDYFHDLFLALFRPLPALLHMIETTMNSLHLVPNQFVVTHIRALYPGHPYDTSRNVSDLEPSVWNAVDCASYTFPGAPVFIASDTLASKQVAQEYGRRLHGQNQEKNETKEQNNYPIVVSDLDMVADPTNSTMVDPLHMDYTQVGAHDPSEYFGIFADLFIMSQSRCVAFGGGGFGRFGSLASFNSTCRVQHSGQHKGRIFKCRPPA